MNARSLIGAIIVVAIVTFGLMSGHLHAALQAINATHGLWVIGKGAAIVLPAVGLLAARVYKVLRPADAISSSSSAADSRPRP